MLFFKDKDRKYVKQNESIRIYEDDFYIIISPTTHKSMLIYGAQTKWCFNTNNDNIFESYNSEGPLFIIILKHLKHKYIFHLETEGLKNEINKEIYSPDFFKQHPILLNQFKEIIDCNRFKEYTYGERLWALELLGIKK